tara:strand:- start:44 stop:613 length:570 start_codon:yes stop_codon:yes gene_type:complete
MSNEYIIICIVLTIFVIIMFKISRSIVKYILIGMAGAAFFIFISSCSKGNLNLSNTESVEDNTLTRIKDIPFIMGSEIDIEKSLILGEGKSWSGQLYINIAEAKPKVFNFYVNNLGDFGWKEQTTIRGVTSVLNYVGDNNRVAMISITKGNFRNTELIISVSPYTEDFADKVSDVINETYLELDEWKKN